MVKSRRRKRICQGRGGNLGWFDDCLFLVMLQYFKSIAKGSSLYVLYCGTESMRVGVVLNYMTILMLLGILFFLFGCCCIFGGVYGFTDERG